MNPLFRTALLGTTVLAASLLAGCSGGSTILFERPLAWSTEVPNGSWAPGTPGTLTLARGESADLTVRVCPAVREYNDQALFRRVDYQPGRYTVSFENLPDGVRVSFPDGPLDPEAVPPGADGVPPANVRLVPSAGLQGLRNGWEALPWAVPLAQDTTQPRYCYGHRVRLSRDATADDAVVPDVTLRLAVLYDDTVFPLDVSLPEPDGTGQLDRSARELFEPVLRFDAAEVQAITLTLSGGEPPPSGDGCTNGEPLAGRWVDAMAAPPGLADARSDVLATALVDDRPLVGRIARDGAAARVALDEWTGTRWQRTQTTVAGDADQLQVATWRDPGTGQHRRWLAWRAVDFTRPAAEQARVAVVPVRTDGRVGDALPDAGADFESELRALAMVAWRGDPVVAWVQPDALVLRRHDGIGWLDLPAPARGTALGTPRTLRLAVDPVSDALVLVAATRAADGATRLRTWRLPTPEGRWQALPDLPAGATSNPLDDLVALALAARGGEVTLAWTFGEISFGGGGTPLKLSVQRHGAGGWKPLGDAAALSDPGTGFAVQPQQVELAAGCPDGAFLAWVEPAAYPDAHVRGAQYGGTGAWDPFDRQDLATFDGGPAPFGTTVRLLSPSDGRPLLVTLMVPPTGGTARAGVRRYAAP